MTEKQVKEALDKLKDEKDPALRAKLHGGREEVRRAEEDVGRLANDRFKGGKDGYQTGQLGVDLARALEQPAQPGR